MQLFYQYRWLDEHNLKQRVADKLLNQNRIYVITSRDPEKCSNSILESTGLHKHYLVCSNQYVQWDTDKQRIFKTIPTP